MRAIVLEGLYWGTASLGNYQMLHADLSTRKVSVSVLHHFGPAAGRKHAECMACSVRT